MPPTQGTNKGVMNSCHPTGMDTSFCPRDSRNRINATKTATTNNTGTKEDESLPFLVCEYMIYFRHVISPPTTGERCPVCISFIYLSTLNNVGTICFQVVEFGDFNSYIEFIKSKIQRYSYKSHQTGNKNHFHSGVHLPQKRCTPYNLYIFDTSIIKQDNAHTFRNPGCFLNWENIIRNRESQWRPTSYVTHSKITDGTCITWVRRNLRVSYDSLILLTIPYTLYAWAQKMHTFRCGPRGCEEEKAFPPFSEKVMIYSPVQLSLSLILICIDNEFTQPIPPNKKSTLHSK